MRSLSLIASVTAVATVVALGTAPSEALACGGCFAPPGAIQSVTDHRMVLSVSPAQTTLWDQFSYSGSPENFSWILPVRNGPNVEINLADDRFMTVLDNITVPTLYAPQRPSRYCGAGRFAEEDAVPTAAGGAMNGGGGVTVYREDVVGPYAIAVIGGDDAMAIRTWLTDNGFSVPAAVSPVIDYYVGIHSDFLALKLRAGASVNRMNPVRVTMPGYAPTLPLRMVSAGVSDKVGLSLLVVAGTRFEAANFPNAEVSDNDLVWDWNANPVHVPADDFRAAQRAVTQRFAGRVWLTESALNQNSNFLQNIARNAANVLPRNGQMPGPVCPPNAMMGGRPCVEPDPAQDMQVALTGLAETVTLTRIHAELPVSQLDRDLQLQPATNPAERRREYRYGVIQNPLPEPPPCANPGPARAPVQPLRCSTVPANPANFGIFGMTFISLIAARMTRKGSKRD